VSSLHLAGRLAQGCDEPTRDITLHRLFFNDIYAVGLPCLDIRVCHAPFYVLVLFGMKNSVLATFNVVILKRNALSKRLCSFCIIIVTVLVFVER
jgi:hypothetical protein